MSQEAPVQTVLACSQCRRPFPHTDVVQIAGNWVCAGCKPAYLSRVMASGAAASPGWHYGGFWIRVGARMIDGFVLGVPLLILAALLIPNLIRAQRSAPNSVPAGFAAFGLTFFLCYFVILICYEVLFLKYRGATPGKMACGLKVVRSDGSSLEWGTSIGRFVMWNLVTSGIPYLNFILMLISGIMTGTDGEKRALHDRVCDTRVVYKQSMA
ncbi:MAG TPA: RDD family protein [Candidatus Acidoferrum sp.]|nr:RDD family protein [Candidatus Acidoferrum sp.]